MKKFYIDSTEVKVEISPTLVETLDESLDNMTLSLKINQIETPYEPLKHKFKVYDVDSNDNETLMNEFLISSDTVELVGVNPLRYKHTVSLIQTSQRLTKHLIRNNVFTNSLVYSNETIKQIGGAFTFMCDSSSYSSNNQDLTFDLSSTKINAITLKPSMFAFYQYSYGYYTESVGIDEVYEYYTFYVNQDSNVSKWSDIYKNNTNGARYPIITFDIGGQTQTLQLTNFSNGDEIVVPQSIIDWIKTFSSGTLTIHLNYNFPSGMAGWIISPFSSLNAPVYGKLTFDVQLDAIEKSVFEVIEELVKQYRKDTKMYHDAVDLFKMPTATHNKDLYDLLKGTNSPNFIFTQASMFDALAEIFKLFDATFRIDDEGYLDIEYFNERETDKKFNLTDSLKAGRSSSLGEERYANRLLTYFQNTKIDDKFPNSNLETATAYIRSKTLGVPGKEDFVFEVPKPIDFIKRVRLNTNYKVNSATYLITPQSPYDGAEEEIIFSNAEFNKLVDITESIVESSVWSLLPSTGTLQSTLKLTKESTLSFEKGSKYIDAAKYYNITNDILYMNTQNLTIENVIKRGISRDLGVVSLGAFNITFGTFNWRNVKLQVEYVALTDGKLVNESIDKKYDGEILTNQNNGSIDINKLGLNMVGLSLKLGQPTLTITQKFTNWTDRIKKGQWFVKNGETWVANNCSYTLIDGEHVQATIEFVKNFNGLASRIELNREKRLSNISNELTTKCEENYGEFIYYSDSIASTVIGEEIALKDRFLRNSLSLGFGNKIQDSNISTSYNASSLVIQETLDSSLDLTQYTKKNLIKLSGYVGAGVQIENPKGCLSLYENDDLTGKRIFIPTSGGVKATLYLNEITKEFEMDYAYLNTIDFNTQSLTRYIETGHLIQICLVVDNGEILGGAIMDDSNVPSLTGWFAPNNMILRYPENDYRVEYALLTALDKDNNIISNPITKQVKNIAVPMVVYGSGNSICFEMSFESPISAGTQLLDNYSYYLNNGYTTGWFSRIVLYTNEEGEAAKFTIDFVKMQEELTRYFPAMKKSDNDQFLETYSFGKLEEFAYYKKPNEIFALNYQLHFLPYISIGDKQCFLSNEYIKNNGFANGLNKKTLHIVYTTTDDDDDFEYSILDIKGHGTNTIDFEIEILNDSLFPNSHSFGLLFDTELTEQILAKVKTWAVVDEKNNIYFASNNTPPLRGFVITFIFRHHRI